MIFCPRVERDALPAIFLSSVYINNGMNDPGAHFGYVCSDLSMNRGAFDAGDYERSMLLAPPDDGERDSEGTHQMKIPRLCEAHRGLLVLQSAQTSTQASAPCSAVRRDTCAADRFLAARLARATASGCVLLGLC